jgi:hypothetical protein
MSVDEINGAAALIPPPPPLAGEVSDDLIEYASSPSASAFALSLSRSLRLCALQRKQRLS